MRAGLGLLRLPSSAFWSMTPRELAAALEGVLSPAAGHDAIDRPSLAGLMARYPDN